MLNYSLKSIVADYMKYILLRPTGPVVEVRNVMCCFLSLLVTAPDLLFCLKRILYVLS